MSAILKKELKTYFSSPIGYIFIAVLFFFGGQSFAMVIQSNSAYLSYIFNSLFTIVIFLIPVLTMRLMSEDKKLKTDQLLLTSPVSIGGIVIGKFLAAFMVFLISMVQFVLYFLILASLTKPDWNIFLGNFVGLALLGGALISIGLFISSMTESQVISAIGCLAVMLLIFLFDQIASAIPIVFISNIFKDLSFTSRYQDFVNGILNISHVVFFLSIIVAFNFLTIRVLEKKRWG